MSSRVPTHISTTLQNSINRVGATFAVMAANKFRIYLFYSIGGFSARSEVEEASFRDGGDFPYGLED
jgi:hypothetical protein